MNEPVSLTKESLNYVVEIARAKGSWTGALSGADVEELEHRGCTIHVLRGQENFDLRRCVVSITS
jgi:SRSO17 transposase